MTTGGLGLTTLLEAIEENLHAHIAFLPSRLPGMYVHRRDDLLLVDSRLPCDTFNKICRARLLPETAGERIAEAVSYFHRVARPFTWWTGPCSLPADLPARLERAGLKPAESEVGMAASLSDLPASLDMPAGLSIRRVVTRDELLDFAAVSAANWDPPDANVIQFFAQGAGILLRDDCPMQLFVGYIEETAVAAAELFLGGGVAGLHMISTRAAYRRRGIGLAMTWAAADAGRHAGAATATLQASEAGRAVYERLGFQSCCEFVEWR